MEAPYLILCQITLHVAHPRAILKRNRLRDSSKHGKQAENARLIHELSPGPSTPGKLGYGTWNANLYNKARHDECDKVDR
ncbi:hypothetical protein VTJ04DRAFT_3626 [Mycothermus thermophilus]|uniref:uncharacterized protein n=1 Tax=Humicola insolens TaxID=85995 RepID=UPI003742762F